jgi:hypothetical protein
MIVFESGGPSGHAGWGQSPALWKEFGLVNVSLKYGSISSSDDCDSN